MNDRAVDEPSTERSVFLEALGAAASRVPLWLVPVLFLLIPSLAMALFWHEGLHSAMDHRYQPGTLTDSLTATFRSDHAPILRILGNGTGRALAIASLAAFLGGIFCAGGWLQIFLERNRGHSLRRFVFGGARYYFRFLRLAFLVLLILGLVHLLMYGGTWEDLVDGRLFGVEDGNVEDLESERTVVHRSWLLAGVHFVLFSIVLSWASYSRARIALQDSSSVLAASLASCWLMLRHPIRTLRPLLLIFLLGWTVIFGLSYVSKTINQDIDESSGWVPIAALATISVLTLLWQEIMRGSRYAATVSLTTELLRKREPAKRSIGGPGGPRYPIAEDGEDEFAVSL